MMARWVAGNAAMASALGNGLGIDATNWLYFSPMNYTGGPALQDFTTILNADMVAWMTGDVTGAEADIYRNRIPRTLERLVPGSGLARDFQRAMEEWERVDPDSLQDAWTSGAMGNAFKRWLSFPLKEEKDIKTLLDRMNQDIERMRRRLGDLPEIDVIS